MTPSKRPKTKRLIILGSTGSIGQQTLDVVRGSCGMNPAASQLRTRRSPATPLSSEAK